MRLEEDKRPELRDRRLYTGDVRQDTLDRRCDQRQETKRQETVDRTRDKS